MKKILLASLLLVSAVSMDANAFWPFGGDEEKEEIAVTEVKVSAEKDVKKLGADKKAELEGKKAALEGKFGDKKAELEGKKAALEGKFGDKKAELEGKFGGKKAELEGKVGAKKAELEKMKGDKKAALDGKKAEFDKKKSAFGF